MPAHKEEQQNKLNCVKMPLLWMWKNKILKNTDLVLKSLSINFEQKFLKENGIYLVPSLCQVQCPLAYIIKYISHCSLPQLYIF